MEDERNDVAKTLAEWNALLEQLDRVDDNLCTMMDEIQAIKNGIVRYLDAWRQDFAVRVYEQNPTLAMLINAAWNTAPGESPFTEPLRKLREQKGFGE